MIKKIRFIFLIISFLLLNLNVKASEGFESSNLNNIFNIRSTFSGATANLIKLPNGELVLSTQAHVLENHKADSALNLSFGYSYGPFFMGKSISSEAFEIDFKPEIIWEDQNLDILFLKVPEKLISKCRCEGLKTSTFIPGLAQVTGYPIIGYRTYPLIGIFYKTKGLILGQVSQKTSKGHTWKSESEILSDIDALPGNSGSVILNNNFEAIGFLKILKTWYGEGYIYKNPSISILTFNEVYFKYLESKLN